MLKHIEKIKTYGQRLQAIQNDPNLSVTGRDQKVKALQTELTQLRGESASEATAAWKAWKVRYLDHQAATLAANDKAGAKWDYARLDYVARTVATAIEKAGNVSELRALYEQASDSHARRAWAEIGPEAILAKYGTDSAGISLVARLQADYKAMMTTPELVALSEREHQLNGDALELRNDTQEYNGFFKAMQYDRPLNDPDNIDNAFDPPTDFERAMAGVSFSHRYLDGDQVQYLAHYDPTADAQPVAVG